MPKRTTVAVTLAICLGFTAVSARSTAAVERVPAPPAGGALIPASEAPPGLELRAPSSVELSDATLRDAVTELSASGDTTADVDRDGSRLRVEVLHGGADAEVEALIGRLGGTVDGRVPGVLVEGEVPYPALEQLEASPLVDAVRPPLPVNEPAAQTFAGSGGVGQQLAKTNADDWQDVGGVTGEGIRIGIVDVFDGGTWDAAQAAGEVPAPAATFCRRDGASCDVFAGGSPHGVAVAEVIHDMAPGAELFLADVGSTADLQAAVAWFDAQGVRLVNRSTLSPYDSAGEGWGPLAMVARDGIDRGMMWFQSVGNNAGEAGVRLGSYHRWRFADVDGDHFVEFAPDDEVLEFWCGDQIGLRWNDFARAAPSDYDMYVFDPATFPNAAPVATSLGNQVGGAEPIERTTSCVPGWNYLVIAQYSAGDGSANDRFEFAMNGVPIARWGNQYSAAVPLADAAPSVVGVVAVGAIEPATGLTIANYSSRGPANTSGSTLPTLVAASCLDSFVYAPACFDGTSASTAVVTGAAALALDRGVVTGFRGLRQWLRDAATPDRGPRRDDNTYGSGELILPTAAVDGEIRLGNQPFRGANIISTGGSVQGVSAEPRSGVTRIFTARFRNEGLGPDRFRLWAKGSASQYRVRYLIGGVDRTAAVVAGRFVSAEVPLGAYVTIRIELEVGPTAPYRPGFRRTITAASASVPTARDALAFETRGGY